MTYYINRKTPSTSRAIYTEIEDKELAHYMLSDVAEKYGVKTNDNDTSFQCKVGDDDYIYSIFEI